MMVMLLYVCLILALSMYTDAFLRLQPGKLQSCTFRSNDQLLQRRQPNYFNNNLGNRLLRQKPLHDLLGLGPTEIFLALVAGLVLFGPETLKSLSKDVGRAAAELKEIPKTFKEGMDEGVESVQVSKMKQIAAEKRAKRDAKLKAASGDGSADDEDDGDDE